MQDGQVWGVIRSEDAMLCIYESPKLIHLDRFKMTDNGKHHVAHFGLCISDQNSWEEIIEEHNLEILYGGVIEWPHSLAWYLKDPTGWEIEVVYWKNDTINFD